MFTKSIRWRLVLWLGFLLVCILTGFGVTAYQLNRINQFKQLDEALGTRVAALTTEVRKGPGASPSGRSSPEPRGKSGPPPSEFETPPEPPSDFGPPHAPPHADLGPREIRISLQTLSQFDNVDTNSFYFAVWSRNGVLLKSSLHAPGNIPFPEKIDDARTHARTRDSLREAFHFTERAECVLVGRSIESDLIALRRFALWLVAAGVAILAFGLGGGWLLASRALRPVEDISSAANRIAAGNLSERISVAETDGELGRLAGVLNSTFTRLEAAFAQQKQFTADASHELRTPIAILISEAQTALAHERNAAEYRETIEACLGTAQEMRRLTETLLELARFDANQQPIQRIPFDLASKTRVCIDLVRPLAAEREINIRCDLAPASAQGDPDRFSPVIMNLLTNAIFYNKDRGEIHVTTHAKNGAAILTVADTGSGIAAQDLPHIFKRFFRADKSRARANGRNGLGLAISKAIVDAHGGTIEVTSQPGSGTTFTVRLSSG